MLMVMIDDATNRTYAQFSELETTQRLMTPSKGMCGAIKCLLDCMWIGNRL